MSHPPASRGSRSKSILVTFTLLLLAGTAAPGLARSSSATRSLDRVPLHSLPPVDTSRLVAEDAERSATPGVPLRVGQPIATDLSPRNSGTWQRLEDGDQRWRLRVTSDAARWLVLGFGEFRLPPGAVLSVYAPDRHLVLGPFTRRHVRPHGQLWLPPIDGDTAVVDLEWPRHLAGVQPALRLTTVSHGYRKAWDAEADLEPLESSAEYAGECNVDVNCPAGDNLQEAKRGVVMMLVGGYTLCSASLVNNVAGDCRPYLLTAAHCVDNQEEAASTSFRFNFERPMCEAGTAPTGQLLTGATLRASHAPSDFALLELDQAVPTAWAHYFNGWNRADAAPLGSSSIHHPKGATRKVSHDFDPAIHGQQWGSDHWRVTDWEIGTTEAGSSGAPLFDPEQRIVGQLHGGTASCVATDGWDEFGKLSVSWYGAGSAATRLMDWLDPSGTGAVSAPGLDASACTQPAVILSWTSTEVDDSGAGNGNGAADPGETLSVDVRLRNDGVEDASPTAGSLISLSPTVVVLDSGTSWPEIPADGEADPLLPFRIRLLPEHPCGSPIELRLDLSSPDGASTIDHEIPVGTPAPGGESICPRVPSHPLDPRLRHKRGGSAPDPASRRTQIWP